MKNITSIILIILAVTVFAIFTNPHYAKVRTLSAEASRFDEALERSKELISLRDALLSKYNGIPTENLDRLNTFLPSSIDTVRLIIDINTLATKYGMSLANISIGTPGSAPQSTGNLGPSTDQFGTLSLSFVVSASYDRFRAFLTDLEKSLRLLDMTSIAFGSENPSTGLTSYTVTFNTYWLK